MNAGATLGEAQIEARFSPAFLAQVPAEELVSALAQVATAGPLRFGAILESSEPATLVARLDGSGGVSLRTTIVVEPSGAGRITGLLFQPYTPVRRPTSWDEVDDGLAGLASQASLLAVEVGREAPVHAREAERVGAIGSAFKLYVLGALGAAIADGSASWDERLAVRDAWKSLPSGDMREEPAGRRFTLRRYAQEMIAVSDNTATDHLIHRLGRAAVEAELERMGAGTAPSALPFLTTREMFALKLSATDEFRRAYIAAAPQARRRLLARVDRLPVSVEKMSGWTSPRDIDSLEWFASPAGLVRAMVSLREAARRPGLAPIRAVLARNPGVVLDAATWRYPAFKGGSEPGVLCLTWLMERRDGRVFALALVLNDPGRDVDQAAAVALAEGALQLLGDVP
jgi:hypothetical protein